MKVIEQTYQQDSDEPAQLTDNIETGAGHDYSSVSTSKLCNGCHLKNYINTMVPNINKKYIINTYQNLYFYFMVNNDLEMYTPYMKIISTVIE